MKIWQLKIKNLGPFHVKPVELDFQNGILADASLLAITGRTGAGKTMLFDAVCVALYGKTPRLGGTRDRRHPRHLLSHNKSDGHAEVIFETNGIRYLAEWSIKGDSPSGQLIKVANAELITNRLYPRGKSTGSSERTISEEIESILGLDFDAFKRSVMLAQGEFAAFLKAGNQDRRKILETAADLGIYSNLAETLNEKTKSLTEVYAVAKLSQLRGQKNLLADQEEQWGLIKDAAKGRITALESLQSAVTVVCEAETAHDEAQKQLDRKRRKFDTINADYQEAVSEHQKKRDAYIAAKSDVRQAQDWFALANPLIPEREELDERIGSLSRKLTKDEKRLRGVIAKLPEGSLDEWRTWSAKAQKALPIALDYEPTHRQLVNAKGEVAKLNECLTALDASLKEIEGQLVQTQVVCKHDNAQVSLLEAELALVVLAKPVNKLKRELKPGKPCRVCGATEHPCADKVELEDDELLKSLKAKLAAARDDAHSTQEQLQNLETDKATTEQEKRSLTAQLVKNQSEVEKLTLNTETLSRKWQEIYPDTEISSEWVSQQMQDAGTAIDTFQKLDRLNADISLNRQQLESAKEQRKSVHANIERYQREGNAFLAAAGEKTGGLTTEAKINAAIENLNAALRVKAKSLDKAKQELEDSERLVTKAQTIYDGCVSDCKERAASLEKARETYREKLSGTGFDSPESHENASREEAWMQQVKAAVDAFTTETHEFVVDIAKLRNLLLAEIPFDSRKLERITAELEETKKAYEEVQGKIGAQEAEIKGLQENLSAYKKCEDEIQKAKREMDRWINFRKVFLNDANKAGPKDFPSFAAEIVFQQVSQFANAQLEYLTSGRYQLKVESIDKLSVIDRWNANEERPVETLSGGESFLTSFALALGLSEISRGRAEIGSLFLDEGFGTLDAETLDIVIAALERLRLQGRSIFLISHIEKLTRHLPVEIRVRKRRNAGSTVDVG